MDDETLRARVLAVSEYWDNHPYLTRHEVERALGFTQNIPDSAEVGSLKQDIIQLTRQVNNLRKTIQELVPRESKGRQPKESY